MVGVISLFLIFYSRIWFTRWCGFIYRIFFICDWGFDP